MDAPLRVRRHARYRGRAARRPTVPGEFVRLNVFTTLLLLLTGMALLLVGGYALVRGASELAAALGVPSLVIGLTVVAFGTSAPELAVTVTGTVTGRGPIAFGNVVGSNLANIGLILGVSGLIAPIKIHSQVTARELPLMMLATAAFSVVALDVFFRSAPNQLDRSDGVVLLLFFSVFLYSAWHAVVHREQPDPLGLPGDEGQRREHVQAGCVGGAGPGTVLGIGVGGIDVVGDDHVVVDAEVVEADPVTGGRHAGQVGGRGGGATGEGVDAVAQVEVPLEVRLQGGPVLDRGIRPNPTATRTRHRAAISSTLTL